jgi:hypothetical protein
MVFMYFLVTASFLIIDIVQIFFVIYSNLQPSVQVEYFRNLVHVLPLNALVGATILSYSKHVFV